MRMKKLVLFIAGPILGAGLLIFSPGTRATAQDDAAALYKSKCAACHGASAEKKFDATMADEELIQIVLKGKKMEKPPNMPGYEEKGITAEQAKALVAFMKSQKK